MANTTTLTANITADVIAMFSATEPHGSAQYPAYLRTALSLSNGKNNYQVNTLWGAKETVTTPMELDLTALTDVYGDAINLAEVKVIYVKASTQNTSSGSVEGLGLTVIINPGGIALLTSPLDGYTVGDSNTTITITGAGTYDVMLLGVLADET